MKAEKINDTTEHAINLIDEYILQFPTEIRQKLQKIREIIAIAAPEASEKIAYGMPTFFLNGNLVHFAAFKNHIGFYPAPSGITNFQAELETYKKGKGSIQFPLDQPLPAALIRSIVLYRLEENKRKKR